MNSGRVVVALGSVIAQILHEFPIVAIGIVEVDPTAGWVVVDTFHLPKVGWTEGYYAPLRERLTGFRRRHADDEDALGVAAMTEREMELFEAYSDHYGYAFYVLRMLRPG